MASYIFTVAIVSVACWLAAAGALSDRHGKVYEREILGGGIVLIALSGMIVLLAVVSNVMGSPAQ